MSTDNLWGGLMVVKKCMEYGVNIAELKSNFMT